MDSSKALSRTHTTSSLEARGNPYLSLKKKSPEPKVKHGHECNCIDCTVMFMLLPHEIDMDEDTITHAPECNCIDCTVMFMLLPQDIDLEDDIKPCLPQVLSDHPAECDCLECILPQNTTDLEDNIITPQKNHPHQCYCANCTFLYMLLSQKVIDLEEDISIVHCSPRSRTTTLYVSDSDSDQIDNIDIDNIVPGLHTPYSPPTSPSMFKSNHLAFPNHMYGVDTPLSPQKSP